MASGGDLYAALWTVLKQMKQRLVGNKHHDCRGEDFLCDEILHDMPILYIVVDCISDRTDAVTYIRQVRSGGKSDVPICIIIPNFAKVRLLVDRGD